MRFPFSMLLAAFAFCAFSAFGDQNARITERLKSKGFIVLTDQSEHPTEIQKEQVGRTIVCLGKDLQKVNTYEVLELMFKKGQFSILVVCPDGQLFVKEGYL